MIWVNKENGLNVDIKKLANNYYNIILKEIDEEPLEKEAARRHEDIRLYYEAWRDEIMPGQNPPSYDEVYESIKRERDGAKRRALSAMNVLLNAKGDTAIKCAMLSLVIMASVGREKLAFAMLEPLRSDAEGQNLE